MLQVDEETSVDHDQMVSSIVADEMGASYLFEIGTFPFLKDGDNPTEYEKITDVVKGL